MYKAGVALNLKRVFPLFNTTKVCRERKREMIRAWELIIIQNNILLGKKQTQMYLQFLLLNLAS